MKNNNIWWWYVVVTFILSYLWQLVIFLTGGVESVLFPFLMWFPGAIAIVFRFITKQGFRKVGWGLRKWWYFIPAIFVPLVVTVMAIFLLSALNWATWSDKFFVFNNGMVDIPKVQLILGNHAQSIAFFALNFGLSLILQSVIGSIFTFGEEFGWRGYLQEKLLRKFGLNLGLIVLGIIWGYWHLPIVLMGWNFPNHPVLGALLLMPIGTTFLAIFVGWVYLRSRSIWMPALAHASGNLVATILFNGLIMHQDELFRQLMWIAVWGMVAALCLISMNRKKPVLWQEIEAEADNTVQMQNASHFTPKELGS
jgi:membrane protease YdiL (CAAX protease family)